MQSQLQLRAWTRQHNTSLVTEGKSEALLGYKLNLIKGSNTEY